MYNVLQYTLEYSALNPIYDRIATEFSFTTSQFQGWYIHVLTSTSVDLALGYT